MLSRRTFLAVSASLPALALAGPAAAQEPAALPAAVGADSPDTVPVEVGPVVRHEDLTVVRVAAPTAQASLLTSGGAFKTDGSSLKADGVRLVSVSRGAALAPQDRTATRAQGSAPQDMTEAFVVFAALEGNDPVQVLLPGWGLIPDVPLLSEQDAGLSVTVS